MLNDASVSWPGPTRRFSAPAAAMSLGPTVDTFGLSARVADGGLAAGLTALESKRAASCNTLHRVENWTARSVADRVLQRAYNEARQEQAKLVRAQEYLNFLRGVLSPGIDYRVGSCVRSFRP